MKEASEVPEPGELPTEGAVTKAHLNQALATVDFWKAHCDSSWDSQMSQQLRGPNLVLHVIIVLVTPLLHVQPSVAIASGLLVVSMAGLILTGKTTGGTLSA